MRQSGEKVNPKKGKSVSSNTIRAFLTLIAAAGTVFSPPGRCQDAPPVFDIPPISRLDWSEPPPPSPPPNRYRQGLLAVSAVALALTVQGLCYLSTFGFYSELGPGDDDFGAFATQAGPVYLVVGTLASSGALSGLGGASRSYSVPFHRVALGGAIGAVTAAGLAAAYLGLVYQDHQYLDLTASTAMAYLPVLLPVAGEAIAYLLGRVPEAPGQRSARQRRSAFILPAISPSGVSVTIAMTIGGAP